MAEPRVVDLRGVQHRHVHRDDAVVISGAEYLNKGRRLDQAEGVAERMADTLRGVLFAAEQDPPYPWHGGALKQQIREDLTAYELLAGDLVVLEGNTRDGCNYPTKEDFPS